MRSASWAVPAIAIVGASSVFFSPQAWGLLANLGTTWWEIPLLASATSMAVLACSTALGTQRGSGIASPLSDGAYLVPGPSLAFLNLVPMTNLGTAPPTWVGSAMIVILLASALIYYKSTHEPDA